MCVNKDYLATLPALKSEIVMSLDEAIEACDNPSELCKVLDFDPYMVMERVHNPDITLSLDDAIALGIISLPLKDI